MTSKRAFISVCILFLLCSIASAQQVFNPGQSVVIYNPGSSRAVNPTIITEIISWNSPTMRTDGTPVGANDISGYNLYWGMASRTYSGSYDFNKTDLALNLLFLQPGTYYLAVAARDSNGRVSGYSDEIVKVINSQVPTNYSVTPSVSLGGSITPNTPITIASGGYVPFTVTPNTGYVYSGFTVTGSSAVYSGGTITVGPVTQNATLLASFATQTFTVSSLVSGGNGTITPYGSQTVNYGDIKTYSVTPNSNYHISTVTGCGGILSGQTYTTTNTYASCTVTATFAANPTATLSWNAVTQYTDNTSCSPDWYTIKWYSDSGLTSLVGSRNVGVATSFDLTTLGLTGTNYYYTVTATSNGVEGAHATSPSYIQVAL